ncbi:MAG: cytochrome b [Venatoribacter sp.]
MSQSYRPTQAAIHWLTVLIMVAVYALIEFRGIYPKGSDPRELMKHWHFMLGALIMFLAVARIALHIKFPSPVISPTPPAWMALMAKLMHLTLYAFLIGMPLLGWLVLSAKGKPLPFFGLELPTLIEPNKELARSLQNVHKLIGKLGYALIALHAGAAIYHHRFMQDDTMLRMLPWKNK